MLWIIGIGILVFLGLAYPAFGKFALIAGGILALVFVIFIVWTLSESSHQQQVAKSLISPDQISITNLRLSKGFSLYQLSGEVTNNSSHELTDLTFAVKAYDCPGNTITSDCQTVGEDDNVSTYIDVPPGQVRSLNNVAYVNLDNMPPIKGTFLWSYNIVGTMGR